VVNNKFERKRKDKNIDMESVVKQVKKQPKAQICLWVDKALYKQLKIRAIEEDESVTEIISHSICLYLNR
jgi:hypothetical protein